MNVKEKKPVHFCIQLFQKAKLKFEKILRDSEIAFTIIRPTAFFKSLAGQINRVRKGKSFIIFDNGQNNQVKPISEKDLSKYICKQILNRKAFRKILCIGGPGPALSPREQGELLFSLANKPPKFRSVPSLIFKIFSAVMLPFSLFSKRIENYKEFLNIAFFYATESMLVWNNAKQKYDDNITPEFGKDTLEEFYSEALNLDSDSIELADKKLFD